MAQEEKSCCLIKNHRFEFRRERGRGGLSNFCAVRSIGYKLASDGQDTRAIQHYLSHKSINSTVKYTARLRLIVSKASGRISVVTINWSD